MNNQWRTIVIPADVQEAYSGKLLDFAGCQEAVGGYVERVPLPDRTVMLVNEDGRAYRLPHNPRASLLARRRIVGTVVLAGETGDDFGDVPASVFQAMGLEVLSP